MDGPGAQRAPRPLLVVVSGKPGSGKSTLAQRLGDRSQLWLPVVSHDAVRSALRPRGQPSDALGGVPIARSIAVFYATLRHYLTAGASVIADLSWRRGISEPDLRQILPLARAVNVHCELPVELARQRFVERECGLRPDVEPGDRPATSSGR